MTILRRIFRGPPYRLGEASVRVTDSGTMLDRAVTGVKPRKLLSDMLEDEKEEGTQRG